MSRVEEVEAERKSGDVRLIEISRILDAASMHLSSHEISSSSADWPQKH